MTADKKAAAGLLEVLPDPPAGMTGWPWDCEVAPSSYAHIVDKPSISIVTPSYNQGRYIEKTIRSVLLQNYPATEYIVVDGGSSDGSVEIIERYSRWITHWTTGPDKGQTEAINKGLRKCTGDVFNWLNSDDYYDADCFRVLAERFDTSKVDVLTGDYRLYSDDEPEKDRIVRYTRKPTAEETYASVLVNQPSTFFRTEVIRSLGELNEDLNCLMDQDIWRRYLVAYGQERLLYVPTLLAHFRLHEESKTALLDFGKEDYMIHASLAEKCGLPEISRYISNRFSAGQKGKYEFRLLRNSRSDKLAKGAVHTLMYHIAKKDFNDEEYERFDISAGLVDTGYLNSRLQEDLRILKMKRKLVKLNLSKLFGLYQKSKNKIIPAGKSK